MKFMKFMHAKEDRPTPPEVYNFRLYLTVIGLATALIVFGYDTSFIGTTQTLPSYKRDFGLNTMTAKEADAFTSNVTSLFSAGAFWGALFMFVLLELLGRRLCVLLADFIFIVGAVLCTAAGGSKAMMYGGRVLSGVGVGGFVAVIPTYISELSPPAVRGRMTGCFETFYNFGSLVGFWINFGIVRHIDTNRSLAWRIPMGVQLIPVGIVALTIPFLKESPTWLLKKGRDQDALRALSFLRNLPVSHQYILEDVGFIKSQIAIEQSLTVRRGQTPTTWSTFRAAAKEATLKGMRNRFGLVAMLCLLQAWSGAVAINYYSPTIFTSIGLDDTTLWTGIYGVIKSGASIVYFSSLIDITGRKWPWITSSIGCAVCMYYIGAYVKIANPGDGNTQPPSEVAAGKGGAAAIMLFGFLWSFGANGLPLIIASEIFSPSVRSISGPWAGVNVWLWSFVVTKSIPSMFRAMGYGIYLWNGTVLTLSAVYAFFFVHETKGLRMDQMDRLFGAVGEREVAPSVVGEMVDGEKEVAVHMEHAV
ncbi:hypothetical protein AtubIFM61612_010679 [Aspergillus tubingensis]|nr:hypothetical protein AtubIFM57143_007529 [Aspergillus tubingensis]GLB20735.1 hypothetical protein AtubIFM61612_010679 [Aspergillus tubingensis]